MGKMLRATEKAPVLTKLLEDLTGVSRDDPICSGCRSAVSDGDFRDALSAREFKISRLCQSCQDGVFGV